jgi:hypothetical protein
LAFLLSKTKGGDMTPDNATYEDKVIAMIGTRLSNGVKDYGKIVEYIEIVENMGVRFVFITDSGRKIDSGSAMRFMNAYRRKLRNAPAIVYPDGTEKVLRNRQMRVRRSGMRSLTSGTIEKSATFGKDESIDITSTVTSAGAFPEEYTSPLPRKNPNALTIDEVCEKAGITVNEYFDAKNNQQDNESE